MQTASNKDSYLIPLPRIYVRWQPRLLFRVTSLSSLDTLFRRQRLRLSELGQDGGGDQAVARRGQG